MSVVSIFSGAYCSGQEIAQDVAKGLGCPLSDDASLLAQADWQSATPQNSQSLAIADHFAQYAELPQEKARLVGRLRLGMARLLGQDNLVYLGYGAHLILPSVSHVLSVCLIADHHHRLGRAMRSEGIDESQAAALIQEADHRAQRWVGYLHGSQA